MPFCHGDITGMPKASHACGPAHDPIFKSRRWQQRLQCSSRTLGKVFSGRRKRIHFFPKLWWSIKAVQCDSPKPLVLFFKNKRTPTRSQTVDVSLQDNIADIPHAYADLPF